MAWSLRDDRGSTSIQIVVCWPLVLLVIMLIIQAGVYYYAAQSAQVAADQAVDAVRTADGKTGDGQAQAERVLAALGSGSLSDPRVRVTRTADEVTVTVTAGAPHFVPFWPSVTTAVSTGPVEKYTQVGNHG